MADLILTIDPDEDGAEAEASGDEEGPVLASKGLGFKDLVSEEEAEEAAPTGWDFDTNEAEVDADGEVETTGLGAKIRARLQERAAAEGGDGEAEPADKAGESQKKKAKVKAKAKQQETSDHLKTDIHFADLRLSRPLLRAVADLQFESPTPIQRDVIPPALQGLDVLATAETGSGKTASFLLPALERLCQSPNVRSRRRDPGGRLLIGAVATKAVVLIPTRELAVQCHAMLKDLSKYTFVTNQLVAGGYVSNEQASALRQQPDIVIATPGRLLDHLLNSQSVHMELLEIVVFDEADRLLEMGFKEECMQVMNRCAKGRQTMLFSATMNDSVEGLANVTLVKPVRVHASAVNRVAQTLEQEFVKAPSQELREAVLLSLCERNYTSNVIVFCATRQSAHRLAIIFGLCGLSAAEIHGNLPQGDRVKALNRFQEEEVDFLIATDLAARGLDLCNVETVVNFHLPTDVSRYVHRVGRTARMGRTGKAVTIYCPEEYSKVKLLGKQCCSKVKATVVKRTVASEAVRVWSKKIWEFRDDIQGIVQEENEEREMRLAGKLANVANNIEKHKSEINSRPAKEWYITNGQKRKLKTAEAEQVGKEAEAAAEAAEAASAENSQKRKRGKDRKPLDPATKRQKAKEKFKKEREAKKLERAKEERLMRTAGRRYKSARRPAKMIKGEDAPPKKGMPGKKQKRKR